MDPLKRSVQTYASRHANSDGLAVTPVAGLRMMCVPSPRGPLHSVYRPLVCLILQGAKQLTAGVQERTFTEGETAIVCADVPVIGRIVEASHDKPYLAVAVEIDATLIREISVGLDGAQAAPSATLFAANTHETLRDCVLRLMRLLDRPEAIPILQAGIQRELHYWLLCGEHGPALRAMALADSSASRLARSIALLRSEFRSRIPVSRLAKAAAMSSTSFHAHFKKLTSLTPIQFQKRLRLIEARRLLVHEGHSASRAAFDVGYESLSQFTREYARMFGAPPKRDRVRLQQEREMRTASGSTGAAHPS